MSMICWSSNILLMGINWSNMLSINSWSSMMGNMWYRWWVSIYSWSSMMNNSWCNMMNNWSNMMDNWSMSMDCWCTLWDNCVETMMIIGCVVNGTDWTVWFNEGVLSFYNITISGFMLWFNITGMWIMNSIVEWIFWVRLEIN